MWPYEIGTVPQGFCFSRPCHIPSLDSLLHSIGFNPPKSDIFKEFWIGALEGLGTQPVDLYPPGNKQIQGQKQNIRSFNR